MGQQHDVDSGPVTAPLEGSNLLTPAEVGERFRVDPRTVARWAKQGKLTTIRTLGGHRRYSRAEVEALLTDPQEPTPGPEPAPGSAPKLAVGDIVLLEPLRGGLRKPRRVEAVLEDWIMVFSDEMARPVRARIDGMHTRPEWKLVTT